MTNDTVETVDVWDVIIADYKEARHCLWCPKHCNNWHRQENRGFYYLWKAYHFAEAAKEKRPLWYARILYMMACEQRYKQHNYDILHRYLTPCIAAYKEASISEEQPSKEEVESATYLYKQYLYEQSRRSYSTENAEKAYALIDGLEDFPDFQFHDSHVVAFSHDNETARMTLDYEGITVTLLFEGVSEVSVYSVDPYTVYISDFYCYPVFQADECLLFDIEAYKIRCNKIKVVAS